MNLGDRISRLIRSNITDWQQKRSDSEAELKQTIGELKQSVDRAIASQQRLAQEYRATQIRIEQLQQQAQRALQQKDEAKAREWLTQKHSQSKIAEQLQTQLAELTPRVDALKRHFSDVEACTQTLKARAASARMENQLEQMPDIDFAEIDAQLDNLRSRLNRM
jgi:phage shock protein A